MQQEINGKQLAEKTLQQIKEKISGNLKKPGLAIILVGDDPASHTYVNIKEKKCREIGFNFKKIYLEQATQEQVINEIKKLNADQEIHGIIVQLPLPENLDKKTILNSINPGKDVDGLHPLNIGNLVMENKTFIPATAKGVMKLIESTQTNLEGKNAVMIGNSDMVGKPISILLQEKWATVTICHEKTENIGEHTKNADILISAVGKPGLIRKEMVKPGAIVIDVGISKQEGKIIGDVDSEVKETARTTPVPGGVGPMTVAMLLENVFEAYENQERM